MSLLISQHSYFNYFSIELYTQLKGKESNQIFVLKILDFENRLKIHKQSIEYEFGEYACAHEHIKIKSNLLSIVSMIVRKMVISQNSGRDLHS